MDSCMAIIGSIPTVRAQTLPADKFTAAFAYLDELFTPDSRPAARMRGVQLGETKRIELADGAFALEQAYMSKPRAEGFFESHRKFIDVQVIFEGEEWMELVDVSSAVVKQDYLPERDLIVYDDAVPASLIHFRVGTAAIFYPADIHMPGLVGSGVRGLVRKTVVKVPV